MCVLSHVVSVERDNNHEDNRIVNVSSTKASSAHGTHLSCIVQYCCGGFLLGEAAASASVTRGPSCHSRPSMFSMPMSPAFISLCLYNHSQRIATDRFTSVLRSPLLFDRLISRPSLIATNLGGHLNLCVRGAMITHRSARRLIHTGIC